MASTVLMSCLALKMMRIAMLDAAGNYATRRRVKPER
jgi:hypothetical protein